MRSTAVLGIGNLDRGDDAAGILAARAIRIRLPQLPVLESAGDITELLDCFQNFRQVCLIDAIYPPSPSSSGPGRIHTLDGHRLSLPLRELLPSSHLFGFAQSIELARVLGSLPERLRIFAIEGQSFALGGNVSPPVTLAIQSVVQLVVRELGDADASLQGRLHHA